MPTTRSIDVDHETDLTRAQQIYDRTLPWARGRCFVIAEAGVNHNGCMDTARRLIEEATHAGADAVKFQTFAADRLATRQSPKAAYQKQRQTKDETQFDMLRRLALSPDHHRQLIDHCDEHNIEFLSSAFSPEDVDLLDALDLSAIKLGSAEITNHPLLVHAAGTLRPIILSTGCSHLAEVHEAIDVLKKNGCTSLGLLHCVSAYPAPIEATNLRAIQTLCEATQLPVGFSDHSAGNALAAAAVALGACMIEKHFTLDRSQTGPDHQASLEPDELRRMIEAIRDVEVAMGDGVKCPMECEMDTRRIARRSLVAAQPLPAGTVLQPEHLTSRRPGTAIAPSKLQDVLGQLLKRPIMPDELLTWNHLEPTEASR